MTQQRRPLPASAAGIGAITPVQEFVERRVLWIELQPRDSQVRRISDALHQQATTDPLAAS